MEDRLNVARNYCLTNVENVRFHIFHWWCLGVCFCLVIRMLRIINTNVCVCVCVCVCVQES